MGSEDIDRRLGRLVAGYASNVRALLAEQHPDDSVYSPLGIWMLLAAATIGARGRLHERLEAVVGCPAPLAARLLDALLSEPPPALRVALALWTRGDPAAEAIAGWARALPSGVQIDPMPSQGEADAWTRRSTLDLIERFPSEVEDLAACLVSALATRVSWEEPFETIDADRALPEGSPWRGRVSQMLCADHPQHAAIVHAEPAGMVAVLEAAAQEGITVICVSASPDVPRTRVLDAAQLIAAHVAEETPLKGVSLFDLPTGDGHSWSLTEHPRPAWEQGQRFEHVGRAFLPAWSIHSSVDLLANERFGADAASEMLLTATGIEGPADARQTTVASFDRYGFQAAAVTVTGVAVSGQRSPTQTGVQRIAELRFDHPFAALAVGTRSREAQTARWVGLPMFEAWVTSPVEPEPERARPRSARPWT